MSQAARSQRVEGLWQAFGDSVRRFFATNQPASSSKPPITVLLTAT